MSDNPDSEPFNPQPGDSEQVLDAKFMAMMKKNRSAVDNVIRNFCDTPEDRFDLLRIISHKARSSCPTFRGEAKISTWLYRVAFNVALKWKEKQLRQQKIEYQGVIPEAIHPLTNEEERKIVLKMDLKKLRPEDRSIIDLLIEGRRYKEINSMLGISVGAFRMRILRIERRLNGKLKFE